VFNHSTFCQQSIFLGFVQISEQREIVFLASINQFIFAMDKRFFFFMAGTEFLNII
jgi:hypothetical protein